MPIKKLRPEFSFTEDRLKELQQVVPEAFADGKINWASLQEALGEHLEGETQEHFGLAWPGKREARRLAAIPSKGTLIPQTGEGVNEENTSNVFIEGENLEVLKLLQKSYAGRVKMIYIDPPYNTGNDFVYSDDFAEPLESYLRITSQKGESGELLTTNTRSSGRFHSNWLNMMYPRLLIARSLLHPRGAIFVSIDDNEVHNLRAVMNEVFGEENFIAQLPWQSRLSVQNDTDLSVNHEYIVAFAKKRRITQRRLREGNAKEWFLDDSFAVYPLPLDSERFSNPDDDPRGPWKADPFDAPNIRPNLTYGIENPNTGEVFWPPAGRCWRTEETTYRQLLADGRIVFGQNGKTRPQLKVFFEEKKAFGEIPVSWFSGSEVGTTTSGTREIQALFDGKAVFDTPKPTTMLKSLIRMATREDDLILDFFAGSCSMAHAVLAANSEEEMSRRFICIQLPEEVNEKTLAFQEGYRSIAEIGKERIRRVLKTGIDGGFLSFSLSDSQFKSIDLSKMPTVSQIELQLFDITNSALKNNWEPQKLLTEILLLQGFPLHSKVEYQEDLLRNQIYRVSCEWYGYYLFVCLDEKVDDLTIASLKLQHEDVFICLDTALSDQSKLRLADQTNLYVI